MSANHAAAKQATTVPEPKQESPNAQASSEAAQAWWNMLTQQFGQLAAATSASMGSPSVERQADVPARSPKAAPIKKPPVRPASKKST
jgi:hypothetical protein